MAVQDETILLHFDIDETPAVQSIKDLRAANTELRKSRDGVNIATKEGQELVQKLNVAIDKNNATIKANSSALEKQRQNVGNYTNSIKDAANELNVFGVNVGQVGDKITSFINPVTAAVGVLGALGAAYASSTRGAKDLEFASNQLAAATQILSNEFAELISTSGEDGEGFFSGITNEILNRLNPALAASSHAIAALIEYNEDLVRNERLARGEVNALLEENAEKLTIIQDSQTSYNEKIHQVSEILTNINKAEDAIKAVLNEQLAAAEQRLSFNKEDEKLIDERNLLLQQISAEDRKFGKQRQTILRLESNITDEYKKQAAAKGIQAESDKNKAKAEALKGRNVGGDLNLNPVGASEINQADALARGLEKIEKDKQDALNKQAEDGANYRKKIQEQEQEAAISAANTATTLIGIADQTSDAYKAISIASTLISTYSTAQKAYEAAFLPIPTVASPALGAAYAAAAIANGLANVAQISGIAAAGGADFITSKPTMLLVGDNPGGRERVTVEPLSGKGKTRTFGGGIAMAGGGSLTFDPRMKDGGIVANQNMELTRQSMIMANILKNQPPVIASWSEGRKLGRRLEFKENISKA